MAEDQLKIIEADEDGRGWEIVEKNGRQYARRSAAFHENRKNNLFAKAAIPDRYAEKGVDDFDPWHQVLKAAHSFVKGFVNSFPAVEKGLLLVGPPGTGKTHLATSALKGVIKKASASGLFVDYREFIRSIQDSFNTETRSSSHEIIEPVLRADVVVMDELGALKATEWVQDTITYVLNNRYTNNKITIVTTNFNIDPGTGSSYASDQALSRDIQELDRKSAQMHPEEYKRRRMQLIATSKGDETLEASLVSKIGERLMSRLFEMCDIVPFHGVPDYRRRNQ